MKEEITDLLSDAAINTFKVGQVLKFSNATIRITKIDRKNMRVWGQHVSLYDQKIVNTHIGHHIDKSIKTVGLHGTPFCLDCQVPLSEPSTEDGEVKAKDRADRELSDGTKIE